MEKIQFYKSLNNLTERECIEKFLIYNASLVISGAKPSATITLKKSGNNIYGKWIKYGRDFLEDIELEHMELREGEESLIILVYNKENLKEHIFKRENKEFLLNIGYEPSDEINKYINMLKNRYNKFKCPHELGGFLGFPIEDVKDFMNCSNKKCLGCGYWLVYNDIDKSRSIFEKYDKIKSYTTRNILKGNSTYKIAYDIKNTFGSLKELDT